jgi:D-xylose transport system ATP-binding protein
MQGAHPVNDDIILDIQHITKRFPGVTALDDVSVQIKRGEIHGFCGENGAGKSTLMKILSGVYPSGDYEGTILYNGGELKLEGVSIRQAIEEGIAIVYQELTLVSSMNVGENIYLGKEPQEFGVINWNKLYVDTKDLLTKYQLDVEPQDLVKNLGVGKMQMVEIAKALSEDAKILILDEPTSALTEVEIEKLMDILRTLKAHGMTCIYISHKLEEFFKITDTITVLRDGRAVTTQPIENLTIEDMVRHMVGREMTERFPEGNRHPGEVILEVKNLTAVDPLNADRKVVDNVSFDLRRGEILGIAGLMGSGRTELVMTLFGEYGKITDGTIMLAGKEVHPKNANNAIQSRISLVPEDRKGQGLVPIQSILNNLSLPNLGQFAKFMRIDHNAELRACLKQAKDLSIKAPNLEIKCNTLSGGNQQKVVIAKWLMSSPNVLIMDDPTRGIDVGAKYEIYKLMNELAENGVAIIMISSELEEVIEMSDRIVVMWNGHSNGLLDSADATQERIMSLATGIAG